MSETKKEIITEKVEEMPKWAKDLQEKVASLEEENAMLKDLAGSNTIKSYIDGKTPLGAKTAHFKKWNDKIVIGWSKLDYSHFNPKASDGVTENILTTLLFEDGSEETVNYVLFNNSTDIVFLEVVKQVGDMTTVKLPNNKELTIETKFLNR